ncbi:MULTISPECIES: hypothetical protein [unclassified Streptomyces]|uniref:hypothetical protein n=1 Tax=unclassified Streptomyces TaxID=2593676 RepID=UPI002E28DD9A|nr:hypothetical protein [Streptomyces sp. NBC_01429]
MSLQEEMTAVRRRLDDLVRTVEQLERNLPRTPGNGPHAPGSEPRACAPARVEDLVTIPDTPYDSTLWTDSDDEGLGVRDRRAP